MASQFDDSDFVDREFQDSRRTSLSNEPHPNPSKASPSASLADPLPTREELEAKVGDTHLRLSKLKQQQKELEQQRVALEEARRRRKEFHDGKAEMQQHLTRGIALLEEAEIALRRDANQMDKTLEAFRDSLEKVSRCSEETWTPETVEVELTRALSSIENARMEWNAARLKWDFLDGESALRADQEASSSFADLAALPFLKLCKIGLALSLPLLGIGVLALVLALFGGF